MQKKKKLILAVVAAVVLGLLLHWLITRGKETTDDAMIEAHTVAISPSVAGYLAVLHVADNQAVKKGDVIAEIAPRDYQLRLDVTNANLAAAQVEAKNAEVNAKRQIAIGKAAGSQRDIDNAVAAQASAQAAVAAAEAQVALAQKDLNNTQVLAPEDGVIAMRTAEQGAYFKVGETLCMLVGSERWVVANYKEVQITDMRPNQKVDIEVDAYPDLNLTGHVDSVQSGTGARFSAFPAENATGNFVKIVQRVPVKIVLDSKIPSGVVLGPGLSVHPTVHTH